jgi:hypothetical protein
MLAAEYLAHRLPSLEYIGCGNEFWEVVDDHNGRSCRVMKRGRTLRNIVLDIGGVENDWWWLMGCAPLLLAHARHCLTFIRYHDLYDVVISSAEEINLND